MMRMMVDLLLFFFWVFHTFFWFINVMLGFLINTFIRLMIIVL